MMMPHVVATAVEHNLPAVWILQNNYGIGTIRDLQRAYHDGREIGTSFVNERTGQLWNPDFARMAEAMGGRGIRIEHPDQFGDAYREAIRSRCSDRPRRRHQSRHRHSDHRNLADAAHPRSPADLRPAQDPVGVEPPLPIGRPPGRPSFDGLWGEGQAGEAGEARGPAGEAGEARGSAGPSTMNHNILLPSRRRVLHLF